MFATNTDRGHEMAVLAHRECPAAPPPGAAGRSSDLLIDFRTAVLWRIFQASGLAFLFIPINTVAYTDVPKEKNNQVSGMLNLARNVGGSVGIAFLTTFVARQSQRHQNFLAAGAENGSSFSTLEHALVAAGSSAADAAHLGEARLYGELQRQAAVLSYVDVLQWMTLAAAFVAPLALLLRANVRRRSDAAPTAQPARPATSA